MKKLYIYIYIYIDISINRVYFQSRYEQSEQSSIKVVYALMKQIYQHFIKDIYDKMHYKLQGSQCRRLTGKGRSKSETTLIYASPLYIVGSTQLADNDCLCDILCFGVTFLLMSV